MENQDKTIFSLEDNPDDEVVEEEVIDRDEEYDVDDDDEEYDDEEEEYDDEDEEYDDEGEEEDYDDGYNDDYYDDRLNKVLDEIAELKRGMSSQTPAVQQPQYIQQPPMPPQYIYQPSAPPAGSEVVMYNEISRLRDELAKNQSNLEMQKEITRLKEDMARDQRFAESQYTQEIKRLQDRIEELQKNASSPQDELPPANRQEQAQLEGGNSSQVKSIDFEKLLSINEAILRATKDSDARVQSEISQLKKQLESFPSTEELNRALSSVKKASSGSDGVSADAISRISADIASLKTALGEVGTAAPAKAGISAPVIVQGNGNGDIDSSELLRQLYEIKNLLGSSSAATVKRTQTILDLISEFKKVSFDLRSPATSYKDKLSSIYAFSSKLQSSNEPDALDLIEATNDIIEDIAARALNRQNFGEIAAYFSEKGKAIPAAVRESADKFFGLCEKMDGAAIDAYSDFLPDLVSERNAMEENRREEENNQLLNDITNAMFADDRDEDAIKDMVAKLTDITVGDVVELPLVAVPKSYKPSHTVSDDTIFSKLSEIKTAIIDSAEKSAEEEHEEEQAAEEEAEKESEWADEVIAAIDELKETLSAKKDDGEDVAAALQEIRNGYLDVSDKLVSISEQLAETPEPEAPVMTEEDKEKALEDLAYIHNKLDDYEVFISQISDLRSDILNISSTIDFTEQYNSLLTEITTQFDKLYEDISSILIDSESNIINRINEPTVLTDAIDGVRSDILADTQAIRDQVQLVSDSIQAGLDGKDVLLGDTQNILTDTQAIITDTQAIRDSLVSLGDSLNTIGDSINAVSVADAIDQIRSDLSAFADLTAANVDVSAADRQKIMEDVAFLREQAERELAEKEQAAAESAQTSESLGSEEPTPEELEREKLYAYLDEISARVGLLVALPDDISAAKDDVASVKEQTAALSDSILAVNDGVSNIDASLLNVTDTVNRVSEDVTAALDAIRPIADDVITARDAATATLDTIAPMADDIATTRDAATATLDALAPITDQLNAILDKLEPPVQDDDEVLSADVEEDVDPVLEDLAELKENLNTILDTLPLLPQSDDLVTARDNTYSILDTLTMMPQNDDITAIRDNVAAVLDAVTALNDSVATLTDAQGVNSIGDDVSAIRADTEAILDAIPETIGEDLAVMRDNSSTMLDSLASLTQSQEDIVALREAVDNGFAAADAANGAISEDVQFIRQKLEETKTDEEIGDSLANILQDLGLVLDKLESYEQTLVANKQEIVDTVSDIREEIHINELDENITAAGIDEGTRDALVGEISEIRERLANLEASAQTSEESNTLALDNISAQLTELANSLAAASPEHDDAVLQTLDDINEKLNAVIGGDASDASELGAQVLDGIEQIKELVSVDPESVASIAADIAEIKARLDGGVMLDTESDGVAPAASTESLQAIIDELSVIREKLDSDYEYDTVGEILSLRDDVKAARIVDQNEVSSELESIKNELAAISSDNILDEIRAIREDISALGAGGASAPTNGELNLVLNEIVSLRDEMFAFKDEVLNATAVAEEPIDEAITDEQNEDVTTILDEITALRADQTALTGNIDELKDMISRRTTLASDTDTDAAAVASNELNVVLDEIINLKNDIERVEAAQIPVDRLDAITEQVDELKSHIDALREPQSDGITESADMSELKDTVDSIAVTTADNLSALSDKIDAINAALDDIRLSRVTSEDMSDGESVGASNSVKQEFEDLHAQIEDVKLAVSELAQAPSFADEMLELRAEIEKLREENEQLRAENAQTVNDGIAELREAIHDMALSITPTQTADGDTSYGALIEEIRSLKEQVAATQNVAATPDEATLQAIRDALAAQTETTVPLSEELGDIRDEIAQLRSLTTVTAESGSAAEVAAIRNELAELRDAIASPEHMTGLAEDVITIKQDVQTLKDEPDLGVMNEILALRDEFQALREEIEDVKRIAGETDQKADDSILSEVQSLRDQLFAISMANVNDSQSGESNYESYNNLILDEIASLRGQIESAGSAEDIRVVSEELEQMRAALDKREELYDALSERVSKLNNDATNNRILEELTSMREELSNQRDADLTTLNFMSEMAHLLERQNSYISENAGSKISNEIESLKAEIASGDAVAEEIAKLRDIMTKHGSAGDNATILKELADLREELGDEKPSRENELILQEIARLRDELSELAERDQRHEETAAEDSAADSDLEESLSDLKNQLNEIAGIVEPEKKPAKRTTKSTKGKSKSGTGSRKKGSGKKRQTKAATESAVVSEPVLEEVVVPEIDDFEAKINEESTKLGGDGDMALDPDATTPSTKDAMDVADKLAKQVANKLVLEQLVEQLGDGGVSDERVEEILKDILPQEFTTVALNEQSDKVRKLANQLVLKKLRERLEGKKSGDNGEDDDQ